MENTIETEALLERYDAVRARIDAAAREAGRDGRDIELIVAAKYASSEELSALVRYRGLRAAGENRADTLCRHYSELCESERPEFHFIGHLQRNKVRQVIDKVTLIHSLDSVRLAREIEKEAKALGITVRVLVEINIGREESKSGVLPEDAEEFCRIVSGFEHISLCGFMAMAPKCGSAEEYFNYFKQTYQLVLDIWGKMLHNNISAPILSMGMSDSLEPAIRAGASCVRIGSSVFGRSTADMIGR